MHGCGRMRLLYNACALSSIKCSTLCLVLIVWNSFRYAFFLWYWWISYILRVEFMRVWWSLEKILQCARIEVVVVVMFFKCQLCRIWQQIFEEWRELFVLWNCTQAVTWRSSIIRSLQCYSLSQWTRALKLSTSWQECVQFAWAL